VNVRLVVVRPETKRQTFSVRLPILIGRSEEAKFRIQQDRVSRKHCELFEHDGRVYLRDLGSTNGTFLEGAVIDTSSRHPLEPGATVKVGSLEFRIEFEPAAADGVAVVVDEADRTVGVIRAADSGRLDVEHIAEQPADSDETPAEQPAPSDPGSVPVQPAASGPAVDDGFGFLEASGEAGKDAAGDDRLGDFLKGLP